MSHLFFQQDPKGATFDPKLGLRNEFLEQCQKVKEILRQRNLINQERLDHEVDWYYANLGIDRYYFRTNSPEEIANHISSLYSVKVVSEINQTPLELRIRKTKEDDALFVVQTMPGVRLSPSLEVEYFLEANYLGEAYYNRPKQAQAPSPDDKEKKEKKCCVQAYRTNGSISETSDIHLRFYFVRGPVYKVPDAGEDHPIILEDIADAEFLHYASPEIKKQVQALLEQQKEKLGPIMKLMDGDEPDEKLFLMSYRHGSTHSFMSGVSDLYHTYNMLSTKKYVDQFSNGMTVFRVYLKPINKNFRSLSDGFLDDANLIFIFPRTSISDLYRDGKLNAAEYAYTYAGWKFVFQFMGKQPEIIQLSQKLKDDPSMAKIVAKMKSLVRDEAFTETRVMETLLMYPHILKEIYNDFRLRHYPGLKRPENENHVTALLSRIKKQVDSPVDIQILEGFLTFNKHVLKTNFYKKQIIALSFRLDPNFLQPDYYPTTPFGIFYLVGPEFRGYHIRFREVARGGVRVVKSRNHIAFVQNASTLFDENYNLAHTQERKNKDIPEGGSKGTILLSLDHQDKTKAAWAKYIDSLLDLILPGSNIVDYYKQEEILFLGPDENTSDVMDWACLHAKKRGYRFWKAFTTGKSMTELGGIPHDHFGMTTRSIHQYVVGALEKLGQDEASCTKFQTGGPDGDLGSNEIKISKDKTIAIVDASGVLYDPLGIDKQELIKSCINHPEKRMPVNYFNKSKLSPQGFFISVESKDFRLPNGEVVENGEEFRNKFHLNPLSSAFLFVPCGGRPESVNSANVNEILDSEGKPRFKVIVEGANLFFTQDARLFLEEKGVILFKDASANKGGVTSSSLEVLAALALTDEEYEKHMCGHPSPNFYNQYVKEVQRIIENNARLEFECLWNENQRTKKPISILSDEISNKINQLSMSIATADDLWNNIPMKQKIFKEAIPNNLQDMLGLDVILRRVPESYSKAIFSSFLASRYVYKCGLTGTPEFSFFSFLHTFL